MKGGNVIPRVKQKKYIDKSQFICKYGNVSWNDNIGVPIYFYYNDKKHKMIIKSRIDKNYFNIVIDDTIYIRSHITAIKNANFDHLFYEPNYFYNDGDIIDGKILILNHFQKKMPTSTNSGFCNEKAYQCKCLIDNYVFDAIETSLKNGHGCPVCANHIIIKGINDVSTTDPDLVKLFVNTEDAYTHSRKSSVFVKVRCPDCGKERDMRISDLTNYQRVICYQCSDGISYPNKFAHCVFNQLSDQYIEYIYEYRPDWASKFRYDNYIALKSGTKIIVEMDGGFHKLKNSKFRNNDLIKDELAYQNHIQVIRIDCNYDKTEKCFAYIKNNMIDALSNYFDLSNIDWDMCNKYALSNFVYEIAKYYNLNFKLGLDDIATHFKISKETLYNYLHIAEKLGLCKYIRNDINRRKNSKPIAMYNLDGTIIGIFRTANMIESLYPTFKGRSIRKVLSRDRHVYKNYYFRYASFEEYINYNN